MSGLATRRDLYTETRWGIVFLTGAVIRGAAEPKPCARRPTLGNNGPGDWWARWVCPLNRPINLDEALAAPSQIFPSAFFPPLPCLSSPLLFLFPHIMRWKSLVVILVAGSSTCILQNGEIFTLRDWGGGWGGGDDSAQFVSLWRAVAFPFLSWSNKAKTHVCRWIYMQKTQTHT